MKLTRWISRRWFALGAALALVAADRLVAAFVSADGLLPAQGGAGLALAWAMFGHCDGMDGPVVTRARRALESRDVNLVLPWVRAEDEAPIRAAFEHALAVRELGPRARELADLHFFETLVRVHRAAEGAPYTGLKPAGRDLGPAIPAADRALESGAVEPVIELLGEAMRKGMQTHFRAALERRDFAPDDVRAGRAFVAAYVPYVHYVERLWEDATQAAQGHHAEHAAHAHHAHGGD